MGNRRVVCRHRRCPQPNSYYRSTARSGGQPEKEAREYKCTAGQMERKKRDILLLFLFYRCRNVRRSQPPRKVGLHIVQKCIESRFLKCLPFSHQKSLQIISQLANVAIQCLALRVMVTRGFEIERVEASWAMHLVCPDVVALAVLRDSVSISIGNKVLWRAVGMRIVRALDGWEAQLHGQPHRRIVVLGFAKEYKNKQPSIFEQSETG